MKKGLPGTPYTLLQLSRVDKATHEIKQVVSTLLLSTFDIPSFLSSCLIYLFFYQAPFVDESPKKINFAGYTPRV
jgi:hypothetical protein